MKNQEYLLDYLKYWMFSNLFTKQVKKNVKGVAQVNLNTGWLREFLVPEKTLNEQVEIVNKLDKLQQIIDIRKEQINQLEELVKARFVELFGDYRINEKGFDCKKGSELFKFSSGKFLPEEKRLDEERLQSQVERERNEKKEIQQKVEQLQERSNEKSEQKEDENQKGKYQRKATRKAQNKALLKKLQIEGMKQLQELEEYIELNK